MADHDSLKAQAAEAYALGSPYLTSVEGWIVIDSSPGFTTSLHPTDIEHVIRVQGVLNKSPEFTVKYISSNLSGLRDRHLKTSMGVQVVKCFEDHSYIVKETNNAPDLGIIEHFKYYTVKHHEDTGAITIVATTAKLPEYPLCSALLNFFLVHVSPAQEGSNVTIAMQSVPSSPITEQVRIAIAHRVKEYYLGVIGEVQGIQE